LVLEEGVLSIVPDCGEEETVSAYEACFACMRSEDGKPRAAVSNRKMSVDMLKGAFGECQETLRISQDWGLEERVVLHDTVDLALLFEGVPPERMRTFCDRWLGGLENRDPEYLKEMLRTLETYLDCDGQMNETAKRLFIHRNTATYRIEKLGELLDVDFKKVNDLLRLKIAFLFRRFLKSD
jgi:purine catabolism regulator